MRVDVARTSSDLKVHLIDDAGRPVEVVDAYLRFLAARGCSPNTVRGYAYDLLHLWRFFISAGLDWDLLRPASAVDLLAFLRATGHEPAILAVSEEL